MILWHEFKFSKGQVSVRLNPKVADRMASPYTTNWTHLGNLTGRAPYWGLVTWNQKPGVRATEATAFDPDSKCSRKRVAEMALSAALDEAALPLELALPDEETRHNRCNLRPFLDLSVDQIDQIYDILATTCGAFAEIPPLGRRDFFLMQTVRPQKFKFGGFLGSSGKFLNYPGSLSVDSYPENDTAESRYMKAVANTKLEMLYKEWFCF